MFILTEKHFARNPRVVEWEWQSAQAGNTVDMLSLFTYVTTESVCVCVCVFMLCACHLISF